MTDRNPRFSDPISRVGARLDERAGAFNPREAARRDRAIDRFPPSGQPIIGAQGSAIFDRLPMPDAEWHGRVVVVRGGDGAGDAAYVGIKNAAGAHAFLGPLFSSAGGAITGTITSAVTVSNTSTLGGYALAVNKANGTNHLYVKTEVGAESVWFNNATDVIVCSGNFSGNQFIVDGATANVSTPGTINATGYVTLGNGIQVAGEFDHNGGSVNFFNSGSQAVKQTVTGSKAGNLALASLIAALVSYGLIDDTTS